MLSPYLPHQKPPLWAIDPGIVAQNASKMGLPNSRIYLPFWSGSGSTVYDVVGYNNAVATGTISKFTWMPSPDGLCMDFAGGDQSSLVLGGSITFTANDPWTIAFKTRNLGIQNQGMIAGKMSTSDNYIFLREASWFRIQNDVGTNYDFPVTSFLKWATYVLTSDGGGAGTGKLRLYKDGSLIQEKTSTNGAFRLSNIGHAYPEVLFCFCGQISFFLVANVRFTPYQVLTLSTNPYGLVLQPSMEELWAHVAAVGAVAPTAVFYGPLVGPLGGPI